MVELIAKRYGTALFDVAIETDTVDQMAKEVEDVIAMLNDNEDFLQLINHPKITTEAKAKMIEEIFEGKVSNHLLGLMDLTLRKGRQGEILDIFEFFLKNVDEHKRIVKVQVTTVDPLTKDHRKKLVAKLEKVTEKEVVLNEEIDASLIGGMVIRISDRIVDNSIKGQMKHFSKDLLMHTKA